MGGCPLIGESGQILPPTTDRYGAVWDSGLPAICMQKCFNDGLLEVEAVDGVFTIEWVTPEERALAHGSTGQGEGIRAENRTIRTGYIETDNDYDPMDLLDSSYFSFVCKVVN